MQTTFYPSPVVDVEINKAKALSFLQPVKREGIESLIEYLLESDYFSAPASTSYHDSCPGGLCLHSLNLLYAFDEVNKKMNKPLPFESVVICALLHDLCKIGAYTSRLVKVMSL